MKRLDLTEYEVTVQGESGPITQPFGVRDGMALMLLHRSNDLNGLELLEAYELAQKIRNAPGDFVYLEDAEYARLKRCLNNIKGLDEHSVPFVRRIVDAPDFDPNTDLQVV